VLITNAIIYDTDFCPHSGDLRVQGSVIVELGEAFSLQPESGEAVYHANGMRLVPGFVDIHIHGGMGVEVSSADLAALHAISRALAAQGVTSFCPTTMTVAPAHLERCFAAIARAKSREPGAYIHGVHMEGPYIAATKRGAQELRHVRLPDGDEVQRLHAISPISILSMAPELPGALSLAQALVHQGIRVSMAHTEATYEQACAAMEARISHATHLFCAMPALHHRAPGAVAAVLESKSVTAELICDGVHVQPVMVRLAFRLLGPHRAVVVSDAVAAAGLPEGCHRINGKEFVCQRGAVYLADGITLAGSATNLFVAFRNLLHWGVDEAVALRAVTLNPARVIGADSVCGSIVPGKTADLLLLDSDWHLHRVWVRGVLQENFQTI
jgi:N-acetylglucosamine-6-phosphate deacetylase